MTPFDIDAVVVGAGVVGLACARSLSQRGLSVIVLEKAQRIATGVSSRNSEVIHAGMHYKPGSLKARLCVEGRRQLYPYLSLRRVAFEKTGKLVVACDATEVPALDHLKRQGETNGVEGLQIIDATEAGRLEPGLRCDAALVSPESGILDAAGFALAMQGEIEDAGGLIALAAPFTCARVVRGGFAVEAGGARLTAARLIIAAGLGAQSCAMAIEGFPRDRIPARHLGKGNYFSLLGKAPFKRLIYPVPAQSTLGLHYKRDLSGRALLGPDLQFVGEEDYLVDERRLPLFADALRRYWPGLPDDALGPGYAGIRPKLHGRDEPQPDFLIDDAHGLAGLVALFGIESPGLTASLALGDEVVRRLV